MLNTMKCIGLNLVSLPRDTLYQLQDGITVELCARESHTIQFLSEQKINIEHLSLHYDELVLQNLQLVQTVDDACQCVPELSIPANLPTEVCIHYLSSGFRNTREEISRVQLEINLQIVDLWLKAQPSTPPEVREQCTNTIVAWMEEIGGAAHDCTNMLEQALEVLTTLQEDPNIQQLETEARELQQQYDNIRGTAKIVVLTQWLARMQQAKAFKEQVDVACHKEAVLKVLVQPCFDEAFTIMMDIEGKLAQIQEMHAQMQHSTPKTEGSEARMQQVQQAIAQCTANISIV